ncbi:LOB domain-containing protein 22, partial [Bienertia sinuspersici]
PITTTSNHHHHHPHHHTRISSGTQACAACKYQRRKCGPECALAPYFPHDRQRQFLNAHKLFGVSNITKIIRNLKPHEKDVAMNTIIFQSDARAKDPVGGCYRIIKELHHQIAYCKAELDLVLQQLELCKAQVYQQQFMQHVEVVGSTTNNNNNGNEIVTCDNANDNYQQYQALMRYYYYDEVDQGNNDQQYMNNDVSQQHEQQDQNDQYSWVAPPNEDAVLASSNSSTSHVMFCGEDQIQINVNGEPYDDEREYGMNLSLILTKTELSEEVVLKQEKIVLGNPEDESFHHISENDLRNAATLFTLTN